MSQPSRKLTLRFDDRASAFLRPLVDLVPKAIDADVPPVPTDLLITRAHGEIDGSVTITTLPSPAALKWAAKVAAQCYPSHHLQSIVLDVPR